MPFCLNVFVVDNNFSMANIVFLPKPFKEAYFASTPLRHFLHGTIPV
jgi:hypothetical protein